MAARKKTGSAGIVLGNITPSAGLLARPSVGLGINRLTLAARQRANQARSAESDELARIFSQLFPQPEQATAIAALRDRDEQPFFTLQNRARLMDARAMVRRDGFEATLAFLSKLPNAEAITTETPLLDTVRQQQQLEDEMVERKEDVTEGEYTCRSGKCQSRKIARRIKQTRSADENATTFLRCTSCGERWREG
jgi:DNA-directed RNA polymerase subunit M/transcription elongation factor TFIIS